MTVVSSLGATQMAIGEALRLARELADEISRGPGGRETALVITKLQEALLWLNEVDRKEADNG